MSDCRLNPNTIMRRSDVLSTTSRWLSAALGGSSCRHGDSVQTMSLRNPLLHFVQILMVCSAIPASSSARRTLEPTTKRQVITRIPASPNHRGVSDDHAPILQAVTSRGEPAIKAESFSGTRRSVWAMLFRNPLMFFVQVRSENLSYSYQSNKVYVDLSCRAHGFYGYYEKCYELVIVF